MPPEGENRPDGETASGHEEALRILRERLYTAVVSDVLDRQGLLEQAMSARIRPLEPRMRLVGRAHTVLTADIYQRPENPYEKEIASVDSLKPGDVMVAATNGSERTCLWGELLSTAARARGAAGALIDGHTRDVARILEMGFPLFCTGFRPVDSSSRSIVVDYDCPVLCGGVMVHPGDVIFADIDGVVVIPRTGWRRRCGRLWRRWRPRIPAGRCWRRGICCGTCTTGSGCCEGLSAISYRLSALHR